MTLKYHDMVAISECHLSRKYSGIPFSQTLDFLNLLTAQTKSRFLWICFCVILSPISLNVRFLKPFFISLEGARNQNSTAAVSHDHDNGTKYIRIWCVLYITQKMSYERMVLTIRHCFFWCRYWQRQPTHKETNIHLSYTKMLSIQSPALQWVRTDLEPLVSFLKPNKHGGFFCILLVQSPVRQRSGCLSSQLEICPFLHIRKAGKDIH